MKHNRVRNDWRTSIGVVERGHMKNIERETKEPYIDPKESIKLADKVKLKIKQEDEKAKTQKEISIKFNDFVKERPNVLNSNSQKSIKNQNKHFRNTKEYKQALENGEHKSYFDETKITREELNDYVLKNINKISWIPNGDNSFKGTLEFEKNVGYNVSVNGELIEESNRIKIHFSKYGFHSVPTKKVKK